MKKTAMFGLLAMVLAFGFIGMGCPTNDDGGDGYSGNFAGKWEESLTKTYTLEFKSNNDLIVISGGQSQKAGTFEIDGDDTVATMTYNSTFSIYDQYVGNTATLSGDKKSFTTKPLGGMISLTFKKQ